MGRKHSDVPRRVYSFRLDQDNVEKVRGKVPDLANWVDDQFRMEVNSMDWTDEQKMVWKRWLASLSENKRRVASAYPPTRHYRSVGDGVTGISYVPRSYDESNGDVTLMCDKFKDGEVVERVFGVKPEELEPVP